MRGCERFSAILRGPQNGGFAIFSNARDYIVTQCLYGKEMQSRLTQNKILLQLSPASMVMEIGIAQL